MTSSSTLTLQFQLTPQDYARANWVHFRSAGVVWFVLLVPGLMCFCAGIYSLIHDHQLNFALFLGFFVIVLIPLSLVFSPRAAFKKQPTLAAEQTLHADASGINVDSTLFRAADAWSAYVNYQESPQLFMLYMSPRMFRMIPKRAFAAPEQMEEFRRLVAQHLPQRKFRWRL